MYSSAFNPEVSAPDRYNFRDELLPMEYGLPVTLFQWGERSYIVLNPERWNIVKLLDVFYNKNVEKVKRFDLNAASLKTIIDSMESEYDKLVLRGILAATSTRSELYNLGLKPEATIETLQSVLAVSEEVHNAVTASKDKTVLVLKEKIQQKENEILELRSSIEKLKVIRGDSRHIESMEGRLTVCKEGLKSTQDVLECNDKYSEQKFKAAIKRRARNLVDESRLRSRKAGAGAKRNLDEMDAELIAKAIEQKTTVHGRRHDMVMYYHKRLERDDLLSIANYHLLQRGKQMIKSATTVYNRSKPKRKRSIQARKHIGM